MDNGPEMIAWALRDYCRLAGTRTAATSTSQHSGRRWNGMSPTGLSDPTATLKT